MQKQMGAGMMQQQGFDYKAAFQNECDSLLDHKHTFSLLQAEVQFINSGKHI